MKLILLDNNDKLILIGVDNYNTEFYDIINIANLIGIDFDIFKQNLINFNAQCPFFYKCYFKKEDRIKANEFIDQLNVMIQLTEDKYE